MRTNTTTTSRFATTLPEPPYYAVIFSSSRTPGEQGYAAMADRMAELASEQPGYLGAESTRDAEGFGITVSYWQSEADIRRWKQNAEHMIAQREGHKTWYEHFEIRIARVERAYGTSVISEPANTPSNHRP
ncbi:antibiotic biosynthesis monooxygenase family protein [Diaphorobacter caeni]|uniref:antibiotic biosynthesis monooxygenase family protein n=1 Tax=Diaphorobacter caeni TaxID=2784387 RepID=UPI00188FC0C2|nr:antibiotic biosynthesis monooxygenase [Diaphorobacter caeni]MBF5005065.1 antibiotic biosynthesis monooxygenase [Diaphorobacter caeni]